MIFLILHRETRKTITFKMVLAGLKSVNEKYPNSRRALGQVAAYNT